MGFKKREYNFYVKLCKHTLKNIPNAAIYGCEPIFPPQILLAMLSGYVEEENFEACKAIEDSIREWFTDHEVAIPADATLKMPPKSETKFHGLLCYGDPDDPTGIGIGGSYWF